MLVDNSGMQDQCMKEKKKKTKVKDAKCGGDGFTYKPQKGVDVCYRAGKAGKTTPYTCAEGAPKVDSAGNGDRCFKAGTITYTQPTLTQVAIR